MIHCKNFMWVYVCICIIKYIHNDSLHLGSALLVHGVCIFVSFPFLLVTCFALFHTDRQIRLVVCLTVAILSIQGKPVRQRNTEHSEVKTRTTVQIQRHMTVSKYLTLCLYQYFSIYSGFKG